MSHTPGPWTIERDPHAIVVEDLSENTVCEFTIDTADDIAFYKDVESSIRPILPEEAEANAKLFLAAPDLLAAVKETADIIEGQLAMVITSYCTPDGKGGHLLSTISDDGKPDFERFTKALLAARKAIEKAGTV